MGGEEEVYDVPDKNMGRGGLDDPDTALRHEAETLSQRFPDVSKAEVDRRLHEAYGQLEAQARVKSHLIALTSAKVTEELLAHHQPHRAA
jgi:protein-tyrosine phosphatase-like protein